ncbi:MAG: tetratricopeptide repeat protein, partial [Caldilineaceae bacterium]|nr:tetratricopeptide repeat protein [Caldilineaceae bacterium]
MATLLLFLPLIPFTNAQAAPIAQEPTPTSTLTTETLPAKSVKTSALTEAKFLLGEGDRAGSKAEARKKWEAAAEAFVAADDALGAADAYLRLADSYQIEAIFSRQKMQLAVQYYLKAITAGADVYETLIKKELTFDNATLAEAETLYTQGQIAYDAGDCRQTITRMDEARRLYRRAGLGSGEVRALTLKAICQMEAENYLGSLTTLLDGLLIAQSLPLGNDTTERYLEGQSAYERGNYPAAEAIFTEVLATYEENDDQASMAEVSLDLGAVYAQMGNYPAAKQWFTDALTIFVELGNADNEYAYAAYNEAATRHNLANLAIIDGRYDEAVTELEIARALWQNIGEPANEIATMSSLGLALRGQNDFAGALAMLKAAWDQQQRLSPDPAIEGDIRNNMGVVYQA